MIVDIIRDYVRAHAVEIRQDPAMLQDLSRVLNAERSKVAMLASDPKMGQAFVRLERVASAEPVMLFGQPVPSRAFNRLSISFGRDDEVTGERERGDVFFTGLISEHSLTSLMMNQNRGETDAYVTAETAMGWDLGPFEAVKHDPRDEFDMRIETAIDQDDATIETAISTLRAARLPVSKSSAQDIATMIDRLARPGNISFHVGTLHEALSKRMVAIQLEASHTAQNITRILDARKQMRLAAPEPRRSRSEAEIDHERQSNPMLDAMSGYDLRQSEALARVAEWALKEHAQACGIAEYDAKQPDPFARRFKSHLRGSSIPGAVEKAELLCRLHTDVTNEHRQVQRVETTPWMLMASATLVSGSQAGMHSDFSRAASRIMRLTISRGHVTTDYGSPKLREVGDLITLELAPEEFLQLLRGHPTGDHVRCTMLRFAGEAIARVPYTGRYDDELRRVEDASATAGAGAIQERKRGLLARLEAGIRTKDERDALVSDLVQLQDGISALRGERRSKASAAADSMEAMVGDDLSRNMVAVMESLGLDAVDEETSRILTGPAP
ncbi:hypothetical protein ACEUZ9_002869 [Paracoccus litorisediminis]|uniref:hypothetical protein n=1 Tax=Paracoccus litorisediminis TaxID=2006130 RepID=UPI0037309DE1